MRGAVKVSHKDDPKWIKQVLECSLEVGPRLNLSRILFQKDLAQIKNIQEPSDVESSTSASQLMGNWIVTGTSCCHILQLSTGHDYLIHSTRSLKDIQLLGKVGLTYLEKKSYPFKTVVRKWNWNKNSLLSVALSSLASALDCWEADAFLLPLFSVTASYANLMNVKTGFRGCQECRETGSNVPYKYEKSNYNEA